MPRSPGPLRRRRAARAARSALAAAAGALLAGCAALAGASLSLSIDSDGDPEARFEALGSWDWLPAPADARDLPTAPSADPLEARVRDAIADELEARGYPRRPGAPTFWVHPMVRVEDVVAAEAQDVHEEVPVWMRPALRDTHVIVGQRGHLVVDLVDPATRRLLWRGAVSGAVDPSASAAQRDARLREGVRRLLARFPPR
jgi:hypothetical protein